MRNLVAEHREQMLAKDRELVEAKKSSGFNIIDKDLEYLARISKLEAEIADLKSLRQTDEALMASL